MSRKRGHGHSSTKKPKNLTQESQPAALALAQSQTPFFNPYGHQALCFQPPQGQNFYAPLMQSQLPGSAMQFATPAFSPAPFFPQPQAMGMGMGMGMQPELMYQQQPMAPYYQFMPQPMPFSQNMYPTPSGPTGLQASGHTDKPKKPKDVSSSEEDKSQDEESSSEEQGSPNNSQAEEDDGPTEIVQGTSKNYGPIYKPGYSKPDDVDEEQGKQAKKPAGKPKNSREGALNKKTLAALRVKALEHYEKEKQSSKVPTIKKSGPKTKSPVKKNSVKVKKEYFSDDGDSEAEHFQSKSKKGKGK